MTPELRAGPGSRVYVTVAVKEVTHEIMDKIDPKTTNLERYEFIERRVKEQTAADLAAKAAEELQQNQLVHSASAPAASAAV